MGAHVLRRGGILGVAILMLSCATAAPPPPPPPAADPQVQKEATKHARGIVEEGYGSLRSGGIDGLQPLVSSHVVAIGPGATDVFTSRGDVAVAIGKAYSGGQLHRISSREIRVMPSRSGRSAWVTDRPFIDGVPYHATAVIVENDELWEVAAISLAEASDTRRRRKGPRPGFVPGGTDPAAVQVAELFRKGLQASDRLEDQLGFGRHVLAFDDEGFVAQGRKDIKKMWRKSFPSKIVLLDEPRAGITPDHALAWVAANVDLAEPGQAPRRHRLFFVYEHAEDGWEIVSAQDSIATSAGR